MTARFGLTLLAACLVWPMPVRAAQIASVCPQGAGPGPQLHVVASGARSSSGNISFTLYGEDPRHFLKPRGSIALARVPLAGQGAEACFALSAPGVVAVAIYHDENGNHHFDRNFLGLPAEGYGFSNNPALLLGPPSFNAARIDVHAGSNQILVRLHY